MYNKKMNFKLKGVWLPAEILNCRALSACEKVALSLVAALDKGIGFFATNDYFAALLCFSPEETERLTERLVSLGCLRVSYHERKRVLNYLGVANININNINNNININTKIKDNDYININSINDNINNTKEIISINNINDNINTDIVEKISTDSNDARRICEPELPKNKQLLYGVAERFSTREEVRAAVRAYADMMVGKRPSYSAFELAVMLQRLRSCIRDEQKQLEKIRQAVKEKLSYLC